MNNLYRIHPQPSFNFGGLVIDNFAGDVAAITNSMTRSGLLEETQLHYRGATPGAADYCGFQHGYRTAQRVAP